MGPSDRSRPTRGETGFPDERRFRLRRLVVRRRHERAGPDRRMRERRRRVGRLALAPGWAGRAAPVSAH
jgi:hypothetical protein